MITRIETRKTREGQSLITEVILYLGSRVWERYRINCDLDGTIRFLESLCEKGVEVAPRRFSATFGNSKVR